MGGTSQLMNEDVGVGTGGDEGVGQEGMWGWGQEGI